MTNEEFQKYSDELWDRVTKGAKPEQPSEPDESFWLSEDVDDPKAVTVTLEREMTQEDELKEQVDNIRLGVSILPAWAITPELLEAVREVNHQLAKLLIFKESVTVTTTKPTEAEIALHQAKMRMGLIPEGIEPTFNLRYNLRRVERTDRSE